MLDLTTGWVTYYKIPLPDGRVILVQKRDGSTRTIITSQRAHA
jgi:hypothetical protein